MEVTPEFGDFCSLECFNNYHDDLLKRKYDPDSISEMLWAVIVQAIRDAKFLPEGRDARRWLYTVGKEWVEIMTGTILSREQIRAAIEKGTKHIYLV